jgi:membrane protein implicated in regulation of membrane protease activity
MFNLPKLIILILAAAAVWYGYKAIKRELLRARAQLQDAEKEKGGAGKVQPLEKDDDGVYRVKDD